jgi:hypothetical protein
MDIEIASEGLASALGLAAVLNACFITIACSGAVRGMAADGALALL